MPDENRPPSEVGDAYARKQCPVCYRMCDMGAKTCIACGADLTEDASVLEAHHEARAGGEATKMSFPSFLVGTFTSPARCFGRLASRPLPGRLALAFVVFFFVSFVPLALAAVLRISPDGTPSMEFDAGVNALLLVNFVQLLVITNLVVVLSRLLDHPVTFVAAFSLFAYVLGLMNFIHPVQIPLAYVPGFGDTLVKSFAVLYVVWSFALFVLVAWKALGWNVAVAAGLAFGLSFVNYGLFRLFQAVGFMIQDAHVLWDLRF